mmetsp:Transcript_32863/g.61834  ORF Transcript_32863/g.61834 Transcript_32863/m.61834 type:complete len:269 (-) Transcript_32863:1027-1833(-)
MQAEVQLRGNVQRGDGPMRLPQGAERGGLRTRARPISHSQVRHSSQHQGSPRAAVLSERVQQTGAVRQGRVPLQARLLRGGLRALRRARQQDAPDRRPVPSTQALPAHLRVRAASRVQLLVRHSAAGSPHGAVLLGAAHVQSPPHRRPGGRRPVHGAHRHAPHGPDLREPRQAPVGSCEVYPAHVALLQPLRRQGPYFVLLRRLGPLRVFWQSSARPDCQHDLPHALGSQKAAPARVHERWPVLQPRQRRRAAAHPVNIQRQDLPLLP